MPIVRPPSGQEKKVEEHINGSEERGNKGTQSADVHRRAGGVTPVEVGCQKRNDPRHNHGENIRHGGAAAPKIDGSVSFFPGLVEERFENLVVQKGHDLKMGYTIAKSKKIQTAR